MDMMISVRSMVLGAVALGSATTAFAQAGPAPGSGNSVAITSGNREQNAGFNKVVGINNQRPVKKGKAVAATPADIVPGTAFRDRKGHAVGLVDKVEADGAVVTTAAGKVKIPLEAFGKDGAGLLLSMTSDELLTAVRQVTLVK
jgi:hypothetical protein